MTDDPTFTLVPGQFWEALEWISKTIRERKRQPFQPTWVPHEPDPSFNPTQRPYTKILVGYEAFRELRFRAVDHPEYRLAFREDGWHNQLFGLDVEKHFDLPPLVITLE